MRLIWYVNALIFAVSVSSWAADSNSIPKKITDSVVEGYKKLNERAFGSVMTEQIEEMKKLAEPPEKVAHNIKAKLDLYDDAPLMKIVANDICSAQSPKFNAYYKTEVFAFSEIKDVNEKNKHTTLIRYKQSIAKEIEKFVQYQSYRRSEFGTYTYAIVDGARETLLPDVKTAIRMIDQFVSVQVIPTLDDNSPVSRTEHAGMKLELYKALNLFKEVSACCAMSECKKALIVQTAPVNSSGDRRQSSPNGQSGAQ